MTIKQVQAKFIFDVENQKLINPYDIFTGKAISTDFKCVNFDGKACWTVPTWQSGSGLEYQIIFTKELIKLEFDYYIDNIDGFCILFGINIDESTKYHLTNVSKSYPSYGNYVWWNPDRTQINDGILDVNTWFHFVVEGNKIQIYNMSGELLYERSKADNVIQSIELNSDANYTPYIANLVATINYSQNYLDTIGLTTLWSKIKSLFATKTELSNGLNSKANDSEVVHKSGDETIAGSKTFSSKIVGDLQGNADTATEANHATSADTATNATNAVNCPNYLPLSGGLLTNHFVGRNVDDSLLHLSSCTDAIKGAMLIMYGEDSPDLPGTFRLIARNSSEIYELDGYPNGGLFWNGKNLDGIDSSSANWIRYTTGLQIVFSMAPIVFNNSTTTNATVTLPVAFKDGNYQVIPTNSGGDTGYMFDLSVTNHTTTSFAVYCKNSTSITANRNIRYIAIGFWK